MRRKKKLSYGFLSVFILVAAALFFAPESPVDIANTELANSQQTEGILKVHYIDVGQGDSIFIQLPNGESALIDAGEQEFGETVCQYITSQGEDTIDYLIGTHPHSDHIGGITAVIERFSVGRLYLPDKSHTTKTFKDMMQAVKEKNIQTVQAKAGVMMLETGNLMLKFLSPVSTHYEEINDYSAVVSLIYGENSFLFTGDATYTVEKQLSETISHYDVLKVGHHGSNTSSTANFLEKVTPDYAVISCGRGNDYGHPHTQVVNRLERFHSTVYRTDLMGHIVATADGAQITFETER